jgi:microcompartment protein CcmL/EutN
MTGPALGIVETQSIARGVVIADAMVKKAPVAILQSHPISPGKHIVVIAGGVAEIEEAMAAGISAAAATLVDRLLLPQAHEQLAPLIAGVSTSPTHLESVAIFETYTVCSTVIAADAAAKAAAVTLIDMRLGQGLGGKAFFTMSGDLESIEAAASAAQGIIDSGLLVGLEIIPAPHVDLRKRLMW